MIGTTLSHFRITAKLGEGGMGEVYLAQDLNLERTVALKILPEAFSGHDDRRKRFVAEAKAASALNHPNITHIYEVGEADGVLFIAMEHVEGSDLTVSVGQAPLGTAEITRIGAQLADALADAHDAGITHRDIKPANIMLTARGQVKVLDFGLAKLRQELDDELADEAVTQTMTRPGLVMGTVRYMSPEQALGKALDSRSDLFSAGIVLYELATGRSPFVGETPTETITKITRDQPEPIRNFNAQVPDELERIIRKCLEKDPGRRYQSARDLVVDLKALGRDTESGSRGGGAVSDGSPRFSTPPSCRRSPPCPGSGPRGGRGRAAIAAADHRFPRGAAVRKRHRRRRIADYLCDGLTESLIASLSGSAQPQGDLAEVVLHLQEQHPDDPQTIGSASSASMLWSWAESPGAASSSPSVPSWSTSPTTASCGANDSNTGTATCWRSRRTSPPLSPATLSIQPTARGRRAARSPLRHQS